LTYVAKFWPLEPSNFSPNAPFTFWGNFWHKIPSFVKNLKHVGNFYNIGFVGRHLLWIQICPIVKSRRKDPRRTSPDKVHMKEPHKVFIPSHSFVSFFKLLCDNINLLSSANFCSIHELNYSTIGPHKHKNASLVSLVRVRPKVLIL
jgi:hypothetical protein